MQPFFQWLVRSTFQAGLIVCLILLLQALFRNRLGVRWHHALWLILVIRMVLPWAPQSRWSVFNLVAGWDRPHESYVGTMEPSDRTSVSSSTESSTSQPAGSGPATSADGQPKNIDRTPKGSQKLDGSAMSPPRRTRDVLPLVWLVGALALGAYVVVSNARLWRATSIEHPSTDKDVLELLEECRARMGLRTIVALVTSEKINTPVLLGFIRPRLLIPKDIARQLSHEELRYVFLHELAHVKRHDIALAWLTALLQVLHWFNPLVWLAFHRMRCDRELACDALVLTRTHGEGTKDYGRAIVRLLERFSFPPPLPGLAGILENKSQLKRRIAMITQFKDNSYRWSVAGISIIMVLGAISVIDPTRGAVSTSPAPQAKAPMTMRLVQKDVWGDVSMSPDRRYLCHTGWGGTGEITVRELATGEQRTIKPTKRLRDESNPDCPILSPDNKTIAYWVGFQERADLCLIGTDGSGQRVLYPGIIRSSKEPAGSGPPLPYPGMVRPIQWFPDGSHILALRWPDPMHAFTEIEIVSVSIADGSVQVIKALAGESYGTTIRLSPDAKVVAYELTSKDAPKKHDIFAIEIDSKRETPLVGHPADDRLLDWTPDGRRILFTSDRLGPWSVWLLPVAKGQAQGTVELVARSTGSIKPVGFAENGSYYYGMRYYDCDIYTASINLTTGQLLSAPVPLEAAGSNAVADWSPDGKYLAYCSHPATSDEPGVIRIRSLATGQERELANKLTGFDCLRWSPDGRSLLASWLIAYKPEDRPFSSRVYRIDAATGKATILMDNRTGMRMAELSPDGKILYYTTDGIIRREIDNGQEKRIFTYPPKGPFAGSAISPNGEFVAVGSNEGTEKRAEGGLKKVLLIPSQGGQATELLRWDQEPASFISHTAWSPDGKTVLFTLHREPVGGKNPKAVNEFWQVSTGGGEPRKIMETDLNIPYSQGFRVHPDGQRIAFSVTTAHGELWAMENFLPAPAAVKDTK
jgi:beta-lactamase regulating signal transducer with metallopeptidase domain/Tol biopolymer transport system component